MKYIQHIPTYHSSSTFWLHQCLKLFFTLQKQICRHVQGAINGISYNIIASHNGFFATTATQ